MIARDVEALGGRIVAGAGKLAAATCAWLLLVARFDAAEGHVWFGLGSTPQWLAHACGLAQRTAVEHVRVARALAAHPRLAEQMSAGRLSYSHVRAISRVAHADEHALVDDLIDVARHGTVAHLETIVRGLRTVEDNEAPPREERERVTRSWTPESMWRLSARLDPERGAILDAAIDQVARAEGLSAADALVRLAEIGVTALADSANPPRPARGHERAAVVVHLDVAQLAANLSDKSAATAAIAAARSRERGEAPDMPASISADGDDDAARSRERGRPSARIAGGPGLPVHVMKRLLCDARARAVVRDGAKVLDVGRARRLVTDRQHRALLLRHHGACAYPGCANTRGLEAHHIVHWIDGGRTDLSNLILLCQAHHLGHHNAEFTITALPGDRFRFVRRQGQIPSRHADPRLADLLADPHLPDDAATSAWDGQRLDRHYAIAVLAERRQRAALAESHAP